jgi:ABC-type proline/glycine betaine transport system ATPase subunit
MDDPISALDANVRKKIFKRVFQTMLAKKTRVLVTHAIDFLHLADRIVVMKGGEIKIIGTYEKVLEHPIVKEIISIHKKNEQEKEEVFEENKGSDAAEKDPSTDSLNEND